MAIPNPTVDNLSARSRGSLGAKSPETTVASMVAVQMLTRSSAKIALVRRKRLSRAGPANNLLSPLGKPETNPLAEERTDDCARPIDVADDHPADVSPRRFARCEAVVAARARRVLEHVGRGCDAVDADRFD